MTLTPMIILTGPPGVGKTTLCNELIEHAPTVFGMVSPAEILRDALISLAFNGRFIDNDLTKPETKAMQLPGIPEDHPFTIRDALISLGKEVRRWHPEFLSYSCALTAKELLEDVGFDHILYDNARVQSDLTGVYRIFEPKDVTILDIRRTGHEWGNDLHETLVAKNGTSLDIIENSGEISHLTGKVLSMI